MGGQRACGEHDDTQPRLPEGRKRAFYIPSRLLLEGGRAQLSFLFVVYMVFGQAVCFTGSGFPPMTFAGPTREEPIRDWNAGSDELETYFDRRYRRKRNDNDLS